MPVLPNTRHERFAQELAQGKTAVDAHESAGFKRNDGNASKLAANEAVQARVKEITGAAAEQAGVTVEKVLAELAKIGFSNMLDYMVVGADGQPHLDFSKLTRDQAAAIQEVIVESRPDPAQASADDDLEPQGHGGALKRQKASDAPEILKVRFKLADKRGALTDIARHLGMFKDRVEHSGPGGGPIKTVVELSEIDRARRIADLLSRVKVPKAGP